MKKTHPNPNAENALKAERALVRKLPGRIQSDAHNRLRASVDNLRLSFLPELVIRVQAADDVGVVLKLAQKYGIAVTTRGAGSSATGSAVPVRGGWVLDLADLKQIKIDPVGRIATVQAGVVTADMQAAVESFGLFFPPDPSSKKYSTIGGNVACNAGGMRCVKYGVTRDYVLGIEGFFASGEAFKLGLPLKKYVSGLNLRDLLIGSEGTLGVITTIHLKLILKPAKRWTGMFAFSSESAALKAVGGVFKTGLNPSILEFLDRQSVGCAECYTGKTIFTDLPKSSILLFELDGRESEVREQKTRLLKFMEGRAVSHQVARNEVQAERIWEVRRTCSQSMFSLGDTKLNEDVVVPI
ncbi:MAG: FAD-binding protein, partial [Verrucomicrobiota bacterium]|nr:FAD-binding protein [Verrucomicrobiota bacterium]